MGSVTGAGGVTRAENVREAQRLRAEGLKLREIAERMESKMSTVHSWLSDPDLSRQRALRASYGRCVDCGKPTDGSRGHNAPKRCAPCTNTRRHEAARERIANEIRRFAARYGRPPVADDWNPQIAKRKCVPAHAKLIAERFERDGWPHASSAQSAFGSWNAAITAAGFTPRPQGVRGPAWRNTEEAQTA